jgi:ferredoxin
MNSASITLTNPNVHSEDKSNEAPTRTVLQLLIDSGYKPESACMSGYCGSCRCVMLKGEVTHDESMIAYKKNEEIIPCSAYIKSDEIEITYEY